MPDFMRPPGAAGRGPKAGPAQRPLWERRSKGVCAVFAAGRKRSLADFATTMGRREAPCEHFCEAKISAQAEFISAEHVK